MAIEAARTKREFMAGFSESPVHFLNSLIGSTVRDSRVCHIGAFLLLFAICYTIRIMQCTVGSLVGAWQTAYANEQWRSTWTSCSTTGSGSGTHTRYGLLPPAIDIRGSFHVSLTPRFTPRGGSA
jgi:hypothetical protein